MSHKNNDKDSIENFFYEKFRDYDIGYKEEDWQKLEKRLDTRDKVIAMQRRKRWMTAAAVLFLSLITLYVYENRVKIDEINQQISHNTTSEPQKRVEQPENNPTPPGDESGNANARTGDNQFRNSTAPSPTSGSDRTTSNIATKLNNKRKTNVRTSDRLKNRRAVQKLFVSELNCPACKLTDRNFDISSPATLHSQIKSEAAKNRRVQPKTVSPSSASPFMASAAAAVPATSRVQLGMVLSPVMSTVGSISNFDNPGSQVGVTVGYRLNSDLALRTGIIRSNINYSARGYAFNPYPGYWKDKKLPPETYGECVLLDIPLSVKYNFLAFSRSRFYATVGVSSYIMLNENYQFDYQMNQPGENQSWSKRTGTRHLLSNADFSIGYEFKIQPHFSVGIEPYLQVPLKGVGWGNVELYSMGSLLSISYSLW